LKSGTWQSALPDADSIEALNQERNIISEPKKWTVFFDGKVRTQLSAEPSCQTVTLFKDLGLQQTGQARTTQLPVAEEPDSQFGAFDGPRVRPLTYLTSPKLRLSAIRIEWKPDRGKIKCPPAAKAAFQANLWRPSEL
jgi:hypothetical protein